MKNGPYELAIAPAEYPGKRYRDRYCYEHHLVWWQNTGLVVTDGCQLHHKDGNKRNNSFDNLELITRTEHSRTHRLRQGKKMVRLRCPNCKIVFEREKNKTHLQKKSVVTFCSRKCCGEYAFTRKRKEGYDFSDDVKMNVICEFRKFRHSSIGS